MGFRVGIGYDSHRFTKGRRLVLGGIEVPYEYGLQGHSDADALLHAVCDAILGALGQGDIGEHFPDTDGRYKDIDSTLLMKEVFGLVRKAGYKVGNVDAVVLAQEPNLKAYKKGMAQIISSCLEMDAAAVNIKAKTNEGMGFVGRKEGVACWATVLLIS